MIEVSGLVKAFGGGLKSARAVDGVSLSVGDGDLVTLLGPSGCGKTTTLRLIAGLERASEGEVYIDGECVYSSDRRIFVPAYRRPIGMVFQSYAIWPHMSVAGNVRFPLDSSRPRLPRHERRSRVIDALRLVGLESLADRPASDLSGGQQQRVALARALVRQPKVLLLDEPLSNLDAELRERMRDEIRGLQQRVGITTIFVTHDQAEALAVSDDVIVMDSGRIVERGAPQEIYSAPREAFTARFLGVSNALEGVVIDGGSEHDVLLDTHFGRLRCRTQWALRNSERVTIFMRPESFRLSRRDDSGSPWRGTVKFSIYHGDSWDYHVEVRGSVIKVRVYKEKNGLVAGDPVFLHPNPDDAVIIPSAPPLLDSGAASMLEQMP